ncbi:MAG: chorismate synthase, partial [Bacteroidota bacterium]|nr:chorismate synthase [Bacteroidota bacterium]
GRLVGALIDGCPPGVSLETSDFTESLARRNPEHKGITQRKEPDIPLIASGVFKGRTTGAPILIYFENKDKRSEDYLQFQDIPRPGHADYIARIKYKGFNDPRGGGMFSGRMTAPIVAAGVVAKKILPFVLIKAWLSEAGGTKKINEAIDTAIKLKDSIGGIIECSAAGVPAGLGEPFFDSIESAISHIIFSIPGIICIEFGEGFNGAAMTGSEFNDVIIDDSGRTSTNHGGGINGGISNGNEIRFRVAAKPPSSIRKPQESFNFSESKKDILKISGRHDVCFALRLPVIIESAAAIALADLFMVNETINLK